MLSWKEYRNELGRRYITRLLIRCDCVIVDAAKLANMNRTDLYKNIKRYGINVEQLAKDILERGKAEVISEQVRRRLRRKTIKPNWDKPLPDHIQYQPRVKNNNVRT